MLAADWDKAIESAKKILGKDADMPALPNTIDAALDKFQTAKSKFKDACEDLDKACLALEDANSDLKHAVSQFKSKVDKSDFGLDSKSKDDAKKIAQAQKILTAELADGVKNCATNEKKIEDLDKSINHLGKVSANWKRLNPGLGIKIDV